MTIADISRAFHQMTARRCRNQSSSDFSKILRFMCRRSCMKLNLLTVWPREEARYQITMKEYAAPIADLRPKLSVTLVILMR